MLIVNKDIYGSWPKDIFKQLKYVLTADKQYFCPTEELILNVIYPKYKEWLESNNIIKWERRWDCEQFSRSFKVFCDLYFFSSKIESRGSAIAVGLLHYFTNQRFESGKPGQHSANIIYLDKGKKDDGKNMIQPKFFEPQDGTFFLMCKKEYESITFIYV
jgi:hypothetical protein